MVSRHSPVLWYFLSSALFINFILYQFQWIGKNLYVGKWSPMNLLGLPDLDMVTNHKISTPCSLLMNDNIYMIKRFIKLYQSLKWKPTLSLGEKKVPLSDTNRQAGHEMTWYSFRIVILSNTRKKTRQTAINKRELAKKTICNFLPEANLTK